MSESTLHPVFAAIDEWYARAPAELDENARVQWVHRESNIPCPECGVPLAVWRPQRAQDRGYYHLAICQNDECSFQIDD